MSKEDLMYRSEFLLGVFNKHVPKNHSVLEVGCGDNRNVDYLNKHGWEVDGIDKGLGTPLEDAEGEYDTIYTMSCLFLIEDEDVIAKIGEMAKKCIITIEGETTKQAVGVIGRNYRKIFEPMGFEQIEMQKDVFNQFGVLRVFKKVC